MPHDELLSLGPVGVREVKRINENARRPINPDKTCKGNRSAVATEQFIMKHQSEHAESNDRKHGETALDPKKFAVERH